jgi:MATE family multidrug resistance protein
MNQSPDRSGIDEFRELIQTAWPLMLSTGLFSITLFVDRLFLYRYSDAAAAAAMSSGTLFWSVTCLPVGICGYTATFVSQYLGVKRLDRALHLVWQGVLIGLALVPLLIALGLFAERLFLFAGHSPALAKAEGEYFLWLVPGAAATILSASLVGLFAGSERTLVLLYCDAAATALNVVLDYGMIFGNLGFPSLGVAGAAAASSISLCLKLGLLVFFAWLYLRQGKFGDLQECLLRNLEPVHRTMSTLRSQMLPLMKWDGPLMKRLFDYGWPAGVSTVAEAWSFTIIMMLVGRLGEKPAAATTLALGVNVLAFIPLIGLGTAVGVVVGKYLVQKEIGTVHRMVRMGLGIGLAYSSIFVVLYGGFPDFAISVYSIGIDPERFGEMRSTLRPLLYFIAGYCVFDAIQIVFAGVLKGAGDTMVVLLGHTAAGMGTVGLGVLGMWIFGWGGLYYWWTVITVWVIVLAVLFTARYVHGGWQSKRVIEPDVLDEEGLGLSS